MIGAGFSRNADPISPNTPEIPLWRDLGKRLIRELYPPENCSLESYEDFETQAIKDKGLQKIASMYCSIFGRGSLDELLIESIPDEKYNPGYLHELLLSLPWSDVFTTNYDTLLERTRPKIYERRYSIIQIPTDIPNSMSPRIIKLHGSFPSHKPFIFTQEDYKEYPTRFAPFTNLVKQSLMENTLCLIGFSGNDPNFKEWKNWVKEYLKDSARKIYLCGVLDLSAEDKEDLIADNIIPIDLSTLFPKQKWPDQNKRHRDALAWLLLNLDYGKPQDKLRWPNPSKNPSEFSDSRLSTVYFPEIPKIPSLLPDLGSIEPDNRELSKEELLELYTRWKLQRKEYPGWVIAPEEVRTLIWIYTERFIVAIINSLDKLENPMGILLLYELNWRLELCLVPLFNNWKEKIFNEVIKYNPYPEIINLEEAIFSPYVEQYSKFNWEEIGKCWTALAFALAREAREDHDIESFKQWMERLENVKKLSPDWFAKWYYEFIQFEFFFFNENNIRELLNEWTENPGLPFSEVKRATILAELGEFSKAEEIAENSLSKIRENLQKSQNNIEFLSQEGWTMYLLFFLKLNKIKYEDESRWRYKARWEKLNNYKCSPIPGIEKIKLILSAVEGSNYKPNRSPKQEFDPGRVSQSFTFMENPLNKEILSAFGLLRICEEAPVPIHMVKETSVVASQLISPFALMWSLSGMIRSRNKKEIFNSFNRTKIATLTHEEVGKLYNIFKKSVISSIENTAHYNLSKRDYFSPSFAEDQLDIFTILLSQLSVRLSKEDLNDLLNFTIDLYSNHVFSQDNLRLDNLNNLFKRIFFAMTDLELLNNMSKLLSFPIPSENGFEVSASNLLKEPFYFMKWKKIKKLPSEFDRSSWTPDIKSLTKMIENGSPEGRERASLRIAMIDEIDGLNHQEKVDFGNSLWKQTDPNTGFPKDTYFSNSTFLLLPQIDSVSAKKCLKEEILSKEIPSIANRAQYSFGFDDFDSFSNNCIHSVPSLFSSDSKRELYVDWTKDEIVVLLHKIEKFWEIDRLIFKVGNISPNVQNLVIKRYTDLLYIMSNVILPRLIKANDNERSLALSIINEIDQLNIPTLQLLPYILYIDCESYNRISLRIQNGMSSIDEDTISYSMNALFLWTMLSSKKEIPQPPTCLLEQVIETIFLRRQPGLKKALITASCLVREVPEIFNEKLIFKLLLSLEYLIKETAYPERLDRYSLPNEYTTIPLEDLPKIRASASELAYNMFKNLCNEDFSMHQIIEKWKEVSLNDPLPEVRNPWID